MKGTDRQQTVWNLLRKFRGDDPSKQLFWSELNYQRQNKPLARKGWTDAARNALAEDPVLFGSAGNRGFDLISRKPHPEDPKTAVAVRFIEVKGRAAVSDVALTSSEHKTAQRLKDDFWLYVVYNCCGSPELHAIQDPAKLGWEPVVKVEHNAFRE